jgi:hypothetical protein
VTELPPNAPEPISLAQVRRSRLLRRVGLAFIALIVLAGGVGLLGIRTRTVTATDGGYSITLPVSLDRPFERADQLGPGRAQGGRLLRARVHPDHTVVPRPPQHERDRAGAEQQQLIRVERLTEEEVREAAREQGPIGNHGSLGCRYTRGAYTFTASARVSG